ARGARRRKAYTRADVEEPAGAGVFPLLLFIDDLLDGSAAATAPLLGPGDAGIAGVGLLGLPLLGALAELGVLIAGAVDEAGARTAARGMLLEEGVGGGTKGGLLGGVVEIHGASSQWGVGRFELGDQAILPQPGAAQH